MKVAPTIEGGLRVDPETDNDWYLLRAIILDAYGHDVDLASRLGGMVTDEKIAEDWEEIVVPDLRESFADDLHHVYAAIETAAAFPHKNESPIWITREDAHNWYSALNQARLNLEEVYHFGQDPEASLENYNPVQNEALARSHFYCALQSVILEHSLTF